MGSVAAVPKDAAESRTSTAGKPPQHRPRAFLKLGVTFLAAPRQFHLEFYQTGHHWLCVSARAASPRPGSAHQRFMEVSQGLVQGMWGLLSSLLLCRGCNIPRKTPGKVCVSANQGKAGGEEEFKESCSSQKAALKEGTKLG